MFVGGATGSRRPKDADPFKLVWETTGSRCQQQIRCCSTLIRVKYARATLNVIEGASSWKQRVAVASGSISAV